MLPQLPTEFDLSLARRMAEFSSRAYSDNPCAELQGGALWNVLIQDDSTSATVLMEDIGDAIVLAFKGTKEIRDWLTDAEFFKTPLAQKVDPAKNCGCDYCASDIEVHSGFLTSADSLLPKIIGRLNGNAKPLILTGHSLGGAQASLAAFCLAHSNYLIRAIYTFGKPRVGNAKYRAAYNALLGEKTFRVAAAGDMVPLVPGIFCPPMDGYRHEGQECFLCPSLASGGSQIKINPCHYTEMAIDGWQAYRAFKRADFDFILRKHSIDRDYRPLLDTIQNS